MSPSQSICLALIYWSLMWLYSWVHLSPFTSCSSYPFVWAETKWQLCANCDQVQTTSYYVAFIVSLVVASKNTQDLKSWVFCDQFPEAWCSYTELSVIILYVFLSNECVMTVYCGTKTVSTVSHCTKTLWPLACLREQTLAFMWSEYIIKRHWSNVFPVYI